jgi:hypothetical protein
MTTKMTAKIETFAAIALTIGIVVGSVQFAPSIAHAITQLATLDSQDNDAIASMSASRKVRCIMPPALRSYCNF